MAPTAARAINTQMAGSVASVWATTPPNEGLGLGPEGVSNGLHRTRLPERCPLNHAVLANTHDRNHRLPALLVMPW